MKNLGIDIEIYVDADACPVKGIIVSLAKKYKIPVTMIMDTSHERDDGYSSVIIVDKGHDSADFKLVNMIKMGDIVVTQDYGVAAMVLSKGGKAINQNGFMYDDSNMDRLLFERALGQKIRRAGKRIGTVKKRTKEQDNEFYKVFENLIKNSC